MAAKLGVMEGQGEILGEDFGFGDDRGFGGAADEVKGVIDPTERELCLRCE